MENNMHYIYFDIYKCLGIMSGIYIHIQYYYIISTNKSFSNILQNYIP